MSYCIKCSKNVEGKVCYVCGRLTLCVNPHKPNKWNRFNWREAGWKFANRIIADKKVTFYYFVMFDNYYHVRYGVPSELSKKFVKAIRGYIDRKERVSLDFMEDRRIHYTLVMGNLSPHKYFDDAPQSGVPNYFEAV